MEFGLSKYHDGHIEGRNYYNINAFKKSKLFGALLDDAEKPAYDRAVYSVWYPSDIKGFEPGLFEKTRLYVEVDRLNKEVHIYGGDTFKGRKRFFELNAFDYKIMA